MAIASILNQPALCRHPKGLLYHYCSSTGLVGMLSNGRVRATHVRFMNDRRELDYGMAVLERALDNFGDNGLEPSETNFLSSIRNNLNLFNGTKDIYAFCLSEQGDLLSQWRGYGGGGMGYALGLDLTHLPRDDAFEEAGRPQLMPIIYDHKMQDQIARAGLEEALAVFRAKREQGEIENSQLVKIAGSWVADDFDILRAVFKDDSFSEEQEWRIIHPRTHLTQNSPLQFHAAHGYGIPFVDLAIHPATFEDQTPLPVRKVVLGPKVEFEAANLSLKLLLREQENRTKYRPRTSVEIQRSRIPFRSL